MPKDLFGSNNNIAIQGLGLILTQEYLSSSSGFIVRVKLEVVCCRE